MMSDLAKKYYARYIEKVALAAEAEKLLPARSGWSGVVRFYAALHLVNAYLIDKGNIRFDPKSTEHKERRSAMAKCPELRDAPEKYRHLKDLSEYVRYDVDFEYTDEDEVWSKTLLARIVAIVEP